MPREKGGINIVNIRLKIASIQLAQISKIVHNSVSSGWVQFGHIWLGLRLTRFSDYTFSNAVPHRGEDLPPYYQSLSNMLTKILNDHPSIAMIKGAKCKFFYSKLCKKYESRPKVLSTFPQVNFVEVFKSVFNRCIDPVTFTVSYKLAHDVLSVAYKLCALEMKIDRRCSFCKKDAETISHLSYYCTHIHMSKHFLTKCFKTIAGTGFHQDSIRFSLLNSSIDPLKTNTLLILLSEYRYSIWIHCNLARFDQKHVQPIQILAHLLARIKLRITLDYSRVLPHVFTTRPMWSDFCTANEEGLIFSLND